MNIKPILFLALTAVLAVSCSQAAQGVLTNNPASPQ